MSSCSHEHGQHFNSSISPTTRESFETTFTAYEEPLSEDETTLELLHVVLFQISLSTTKSHNPHNRIKIKTTTSNTSLPSLFISNARSLVNKIDELSSTVSNYSADIVVITETWLSNNVDNSVIGLNGFSTFRHDRSDGRRGGGVCVYVNNRFPVFHLEDISVPDIESIWLLLKPSRLPRGFNSIILGAIYHPPRNDDRSLYPC